DNRFLATGCMDSRIRIFDVKTGEREAMFKAHDRDSVDDLQFTSDGKLLASSGNDGAIRLWDVSDVKNPTEKKVLKAHATHPFGKQATFDRSHGVNRRPVVLRPGLTAGLPFRG